MYICGARVRVCHCVQSFNLWDWRANQPTTRLRTPLNFILPLYSLSILEERQARVLVKRGLTSKRSVLTGVRQLSTKHPVFICTLPENVMDPLSLLSTNQDVEFGCFSYALEAAMVREQISSHSSHTKRACSNFSSDEWDLLRATSAQLAVLLRVHKAK